MMKDISEKRIKIACCAVWLLFSLAYIIYCNRVYIELPYLSWFKQIPLADLYYLGELRISDLFSGYVEHGMLANNIIYLINVVLFHGTALFDVYLNDINVIICGGLLAYGTVKILEFKPSTIFWVAAESVFMFSFIQGSSGGMETQVRLGLLFFLLAMWMVDRELKDTTHCSQLHFCGTLCMIILSINVFGTLYSFAGVPCVWAIILFLQWKDGRKVNRNRILIAIVYLLTIPIYLMEYGGIGGASDKLNAGKFLSAFIHPVEAVKGLFAWYANGILGWAYHESVDYKASVFLTVGAVIFLITVVSIVLFFKDKMYFKTWLPLMCIMYSLGVFALVYLGRTMGWEWFSNEWYTVHIKISIAATIWIYGYHCDRSDGKWKKEGMLAVCVLTVITGIVGNIYTVKRAPAVHSYFAEKQKYLYIDDEKDMPVDKEGLTPLLCSLDVTMESIDIMKKYNLSVYQYWDAWEKCPTTRLPDNQIKYLSGRYDDGWCEEEMKFSLHTGEISKLEIHYMAQKEQNLTIMVNGVIEENIQLKEGKGTFDIPCASNMDMVVSIKSDYSARLIPPDERVASYCIRDIKCVE